MRRIRAWFDAAGVLEVDTPALSSYAVSDTHIESFEIQRSLISRGPIYLHTSPEVCMKRLLSEGYPDIFSICRVFRDGESGPRHQPEFTMIEWYRLGFGLQDIVDDTTKLIEATVGTAVLTEQPVQYEYRDVFLQFANIDPLTATVDELADAAHADSDLRNSLGDERDDWLDLLLATHIAPAFDPQRLTVLRHYPASQAALARLCPDEPRVADRFEVFLGPLELANGYVELTDAEEQLHRMLADNANRRRRNRTVRPHDRSLLAALEAGLPASAGVAMGFERLQMIHDRTDDIRDVVTLFDARNVFA
ncbi:MAG: EF-P lysine aminoacylase GenX [Gammaproteobacteria bacterium]|nr:EF-P lysine aminoacylase GenX [Gammaproteobacteria bacterium]MBT8111463.1 EF-P lysine aminoacylase GenX [Gammaproteobacteria bacterium]NNL46161.1 EF-P lysine aminoacylase GenX [Woeseiaceae bacterium]